MNTIKLKLYIEKTISIFLKVCLILIFIFPFYWMIITGFKTFDETITFPPTLFPKKIMWSNFVEVWNSGPYDVFIRNSVIVTLSVVVIQLIVMIPAAYSFAKYNFRFKNILFGFVIIAFMIPTQITFVSVYLMFADWNLLNTLIPQIIPFGANAFGIFLLRQAFKQIPEEIVESARIDNAKELQIAFRIMLPMSKSTMATIALFSFVAHWNDYFWPFVMTNSDAVRTLPIGISMLKNVEGAYAWNIIMAGNVLLVMPIIIIYIFMHKQIINAFVYKGIK